MQPSRTFNFRALIVWVSVTGFVMATAIAYAAWALTKGFDITDEAWAYSLIASNRIATGEAWGFQHLLHPIFLLFGQSVLAFRVLRLIGYIVLGLVSVFALKKILDRFDRRLPWLTWVFVMIVAQSGTLFAFAYPPRYLSYNELSSWLSQIGVLILLVLLAQRVPTTRPGLRPALIWAGWVGLGVILALLVVAKITSGALFAALGLVVILVPRTGLVLWKRIVAVLAGLSGTVLLLALCRFPLAAYIQNLWDLAFNPSAQSAYGHPISEVIVTSVKSVQVSLTVLIPSLVVLLATVALLVASATPFRDPDHAKRASVISRTAAIAGVIAMVMPFLLSGIDIFTRLGALSLYIGIGAAFIAILSLNRNRVLGKNPNEGPFAIVGLATIVVAALLFAATPFISAFGTNNPLAGQLLYAVTVWAAVLATGLAIVLERLRRLHSRLWMVPAGIMLSLTVLLSALLFTDGQSPYRTAPFAQQHATTKATSLGGIRLTGDTAEWADWITAQNRRLNAQKVPTVALSASGALFLFNNSSFASPWIDQFWPVSFASIEKACNSRHPKQLLVLEPANVTPDSARGAADALRSCGFEFPSQFRRVAHHSSADPSLDLTIWRLDAVAATGR
jgi:hypothetical protein